MARHKTNRVVCPVCGKEFGTSAEHEEHKKIVHNVMDKTTLSPQKANPHDLEPADDTPTTELPPGAESAVNQGGGHPSGTGAPGKSKGAAR